MMRLLLGLILLIVIVGLVVWTQWRKVHPIVWGIGGVIVAIYTILIVMGGTYTWYNEPKSVPFEENVVLSFIRDMNPELVQKMKKIEAEIVLANNKIEQLQDLKRAFPNQAEMINQKINHWQTLKTQLTQVSNNIDQQVEKAYVAYKIDEIQGRHKFSVLSQELLKEANTVLANAESTKSVIEENLDE